MFEYRGSEKFDVGKGLGEYEYDFFMIKIEEDFLAIMNHYELIFKRFNYYLDGYKVRENNIDLSPVVQTKMKEHDANICLTFVFDEYMKNNIVIKKLIVNKQKPDGTYNTYRYYYYQFKERNAIDYLESGVAYAQAELHNAAIKYFSQGILLEPGIPNLYYFRGISYHEKNNFKQAISDLSKAIELEPTESSYYAMRGCIFNDIKNIEKAKEDISKALELNPKDKLAKKCFIELNQQ